jgi:hypothetical protein
MGSTASTSTSTSTTRTAISSMATTACLSETNDQILFVMGYEKSSNVVMSQNMTTMERQQHIKIPLAYILYLILLLDTIRMIIIVFRE